MIRLPSDKDLHNSGIINEVDANIGKSTDMDALKQGDIPYKDTKKVWVTPTVKEIKIGELSDDWWLDDLG